jgi:hypothetical protein
MKKKNIDYQIQDNGTSFNDVIVEQQIVARYILQGI